MEREKAKQKNQKEKKVKMELQPKPTPAVCILVSHTSWRLGFHFRPRWFFYLLLTLVLAPVFVAV